MVVSGFHHTDGGQVSGFPLTTCGNDPSSLLIRRADIASPCQQGLNFQLPGFLDSNVVEADLGVSLEKLEAGTFYNRIGELYLEGLFC